MGLLDFVKFKFQSKINPQRTINLAVRLAMNLLF